MHKIENKLRNIRKLSKQQLNNCIHLCDDETVKLNTLIEKTTIASEKLNYMDKKEQVRQARQMFVRFYNN